MLDFGIIRNLYKDADSINSQHQVVAEWNMNKYIPIKEYGIYKGSANQLTASYSAGQVSASIVVSGQNYFIYDDGSKEVDESQEYFSDLASVFRPNRPDPGIILLQKFGSMTFAPSFTNTKVSLMTTASARYYPGSPNRSYDYFNSAKIIDSSPLTGGGKDFNVYATASYGISNPLTGNIAHANPYVIYDSASGVFCNKITIKLQKHLCVPQKFSVDILRKSSSAIWSTIYTSSSASDFSTGILNLYYNNGSWSKDVARVDDINQLTATSPTELEKIVGIRFRVEQLTLVKFSVPPEKDINSPGSLELIEISPRLEVDLSSYAESFNFSTSMADSTNFGLPVGSIVAGTGAINLSNEDGQFLLSNTLSSLKMLNQDVKFSFFQKVYVPSASTTATIPLKVLYSNQWNLGQDYSVSVNLEDGMKYLRQTNAPDLLFSSFAAMSSIILILLDNVGITGLEFKKSSDALLHDKEDTRIKNFFCKKEQTVAEVLEQIAIATQCSMYYDASGRLNVLTKEKLSENASSASSTGPADLEQKTDFWFLGDENYSVTDAEYSFINGYRANIASIAEQKINPITDGEIVYHTYGPKKGALAETLASEKPTLLDKLRIDEIPMSSLAFSNYGYTTTILWRPGEDNQSVLGAANVNQDVTNKKLKNIFTLPFEASDEDNFIRKLYASTSSASIFATQELRSEAKRSLIIYLDVNEGVTIVPFEGMVLVDKEYIRYRGKLYYVASSNPILSGYRLVFSLDEFRQLIANVQKGDSLSFRGLVVDVKTEIIGKQNNLYTYRVVDDGRGALKTTIAEHFALAEDSDGIEESGRFKLMLGGTRSESNNMPGELKATTKFNFLDKIRYKSGRRNLGTLPAESLQSYLGFLHLTGPTSPKEDSQTLLGLTNPNKYKNVAALLEKNNDQVDKAVPGDFDSYIYLEGERNIYGQKITLDFEPNAISTRMRLYSPRRNIKDNETLMSTNSSIAGIGFGLNANNEGYFLEVESAGAGKQFVDEQKAWKKNLRLYRVKLKEQDNGKNVYEPKVLLLQGVGAFTVFDTSIEIIKSDDVNGDAVFELDILIEKFQNAMIYTILYGGQEIGTYTEPINQAVGVNSNTIFMFVRNDSQAIYEYIMAAARPYDGVIKKGKRKSWLKNYKHFNRQIEKGIIPVNKSFLFTDKEKGIKFYFNDFARLAREAKEYEIRFSAPAYVSALLDISKVNPKYFVQKYEATSFGAKLTLVNSSGGAITLGDESDLPIYIVGVAAEEIHTGTVTMKDINDTIQDDKKRVTEREKNTAIYGVQSFTLDSQYIQSIAHAKNMMRWVSRYCSRPRISLNIETFANPLLELGDKVRVFDKSRGYNQNNEKYGSKTFVVSAITYSVTSGGPTMNLSLTEVGEA